MGWVRARTCVGCAQEHGTMPGIKQYTRTCTACYLSPTQLSVCTCSTHPCFHNRLEAAKFVWVLFLYFFWGGFPFKTRTCGASPKLCPRHLEPNFQTLFKFVNTLCRTVKQPLCVHVRGRQGPRAVISLRSHIRMEKYL